MQNLWHDLRLCPRPDRRPRRNRAGAPTESEKVIREKITGTNARHECSLFTSCQTQGYFSEIVNSVTTSGKRNREDRADFRILVWR